MKKQSKEKFCEITDGGEIIDGEAYSGPAISHNFDNMKRMINKFGLENAIDEYIKLGNNILEREQIKEFFIKAMKYDPKAK